MAMRATKGDEDSRPAVPPADARGSNPSRDRKGAVVFPPSATRVFTGVPHGDARRQR
jgi:hypothetical protein